MSGWGPRTVLEVAELRVPVMDALTEARPYKARLDSWSVR
jgi:hypothetical protein